MAELQIVVGGAEPTQDESRQEEEPSENISEIHPEEKRRDHREEDQKPPHRRRIFFLAVQFSQKRNLVNRPDRLADFHLIEFFDEARPEKDRHEERCSGRENHPS